MPDIIQQLLDLKEWSQDSARYERRLNFRGGQLVQPGPGRQGYQGKDIKFGSGTDTSAMDSPKYYKTVRAELNKIKKQRHKVEFFDWKEGDDWYKALKKRLGGMNREHMNKLLNKVVAEEFPLSYAGKAGRQAYKNDTVVRAFLGHLETVGEFDGNEKMAKILEQFQSTHPDHKFETINKTFRKWANGDFEVRGVDRSKLTKADLDAIKNWKPQVAGNRTLIREQQLKYLHGLNDTLGNRNLKTIESMFKKKFPNAPENAFWHRVDQLNQLKRTGKVISGLNTTKSYKWNSVGERSNWLKEGFGAQFQGNYNKLINKADKLAAQGNRQGANRLYAAADKFFGPDGIFTKAGGQGEHPLSRLMGGVDQELKINSLVRGDLNQWKRLNFDDPVMKLMNDYAKTKPGSPERTKIINEIENRKKLMNILTESPNEKGIVESVKFNYGAKSISPSSSVVPIDQVKNFNVEDYVTRGDEYLKQFTKKGGIFLDEAGTIGTKAMDFNEVTKFLKDAGFKIDKCLKLAKGGSPDQCIRGVIQEAAEDVKKGKPGAEGKFKKSGRRLGLLFGWLDVPLEISFAAPHLLMGDVQAAKRATTFGLAGWGKVDLDNVDDPEARKYLKHRKDTEDWINNWEKHYYYSEKLKNLPDDASRALRKDIEARVNKRASNMESIAQNYDGYDRSGSENENWAYNPEEMAGKRAAKNWIDTKVETDLDKQLAETHGLHGDPFLLDLASPYADVEKEKLRASPKDLESFIETKGQDFWGNPEGWWFYKPLKQEEAEAHGVGNLYDDYYMGASEGKDIRDSYSSIPLDYASQLGALEAKETREGLEALRYNPLSEMYYAGGGIAGIRRPWAIPPESGPDPQGIMGTRTGFREGSKKKVPWYLWPYRQAQKWDKVRERLHKEGAEGKHTLEDVLHKAKYPFSPLIKKWIAMNKRMLGIEKQ